LHSVVHGLFHLNIIRKKLKQVRIHLMCTWVARTA
jgi:hypothetical protein